MAPTPRKAQLTRVKPKQTQAHWRRAAWIGVLALAALATYFQFLRPTAAPTQVAKTQAPKATAVLAKNDPAPAPPAPAKPTEIAPAPTPKPPPPAEPTSVAEPSVVVAPTEAERLAAESAMLLTGMDCQRDAAIRRDADLLERTIDGKAWDAYRGLLGKSITTALTSLAPGQGLNRFDQVWKEPVLYQAILRWKTLGALPEATITPLVTNHYTAGMLSWLLHNNKAMEELLITIHPKDDSAKALKFLMDVWPLNEQKYAKYFSLAVACAVVFDQPISVTPVAGTDEKSASGVQSQVDPVKRYLWYVENDGKGKLAAPVHRSSARDLIWVVCAPVPTPELEWSLEKMRLHRKTWGSSYEMIKYLMKRAVEGYNPYAEYSFAEILKWGGICGDRAYFCVNTARAQGIPAMTIAGETQLGGHAWAGIKTDPETWNTSIGRISGASKGMAANPQTGEAMSEQEIQLWNEHLHKNPNTSLAVARHLWLADFFAASHNPSDHAATIHLAHRIGHTFIETWQALHALLIEQTSLTGEPPAPNNLAEWKDFVRDMRREYKGNPRMAVLAAKAETEYIFPYGSEGEAKRTFLRERRRVERNSGEQKDLIASSLKREAEVILQRGGPNAKRDIGNLYERSLREYGGSITGFKMMAEDYFTYCKEDQELAHKAARNIELAFDRVVKTGSIDWFRATTEVGIYKMICGYYRAAGDPKHADVLEKRSDILLRRAKRSAL